MKRFRLRLSSVLWLVAIAGTMLWYSHIRASQNEPVPSNGAQDALSPPSQVAEEERALAEFLEAYRLAPGQNLKHVPPPRLKGVRVWYRRQEPKLGDIEDVRAMAFNWRDPDQLRLSSTMFGETDGLTIRELPRWLNMGLYSYEVEGDPELLKSKIGGDWIVRDRVPAEQLVQPLAAIIQRAIRQRITLELRQVERDVVVARGRYHSSPLPDHAEDEIEIYAREIAKEDDDRGGGAGVFPAFLRSMAEWIGRPIVNEVDIPPKKNIAWHYNQREAPTEKARRDDREGALVLKHLAEQTGLTFTREKRSIRILFVQRAVASKQLFMKSGE
jgi:Protein of unknown function (DUF3738)